MNAKTARKNKGITLAQLSKDTGLSIALLSKVENGKHTLSNRTKRLLETYYNCEITTDNKITQLELQIEQLNNEIELYKDEIDLLHAQIAELQSIIYSIKEIVN